MLKSIRIALLKRKLGASYLAYLEELDRYSCGGHLTDHINPNVSRLRTRCNRILAALGKLDPDNCPFTRIA